MNFERIAAIARKLYALGARILGPVAGVSIAVLAFILRRRTAQLRAAEVQVLEEKENLENSKLKTEITTLEEKVAADEKERLSKSLLRNVLDDGREPKPRK